MANWIKLGAADMLPAGTMQEVQTGDQVVLLARVGETYYATQARCPHLRAHLAKGALNNQVITCPAHGSTFDATTGRNLAWVEGLPGLLKGVARALAKPKDLQTFPVKIEDGAVWINLGTDS
ncbi:MAG: Rieske 2Fe-2S domain-containing protein [Anaerolineae bacterium]|nr:Rieske 2Fe-2S domain-containing protein [Anaerolineae bacterium]